jgi:hypothetical protein
MSRALKRARLSHIEGDLIFDATLTPAALADRFERLNPRELERIIRRILETGSLAEEGAVLSAAHVAHGASLASNGPGILLAIAREHPKDAVAGFVQAACSPFFEGADQPESTSGAQFMAGACALAFQADHLLAVLGERKVLPWACIRLLFSLGRGGMVCSWLTTHGLSSNTNWVWGVTSGARRSELCRLLEVTASTAAHACSLCAAATKEHSEHDADADFAALASYLSLFCTTALAATQTKLPQTGDCAYEVVAQTLFDALGDLGASIASRNSPRTNPGALLTLGKAAVWASILALGLARNDVSLTVLSAWHRACPVPALHAAALLIDLASSSGEASSDAARTARRVVAKSVSCSFDEGSFLFLPSTPGGVVSLGRALSVAGAENPDCWFNAARLTSALLEVSGSCPSSLPESVGGLAIDALAAALGEGGVLESSQRDVHDWILGLLMNERASGQEANRAHPSLSKLLSRYARACVPRASCQFSMRPLLPVEVSVFTAVESMGEGSSGAVAFVRSYCALYNGLGFPSPFDYGDFIAQLPAESSASCGLPWCKDELQWANSAAAGSSLVTAHRFRLLATSDSPEGHLLLCELLPRLVCDPPMPDTVAQALAAAWSDAFQRTRRVRAFLLATANSLLAASQLPTLRWADLVREPLVLLSLGHKLLRPPLLSVVLAVLAAVRASPNWEQAKLTTSSGGADGDTGSQRYFDGEDDPESPEDDALGLLTDVILSRSVLSLCAVAPFCNSSDELTPALLVAQWLDARVSQQPQLLQALVLEGLTFRELAVITSTLNVTPRSHIWRRLPLLMAYMLRPGATLDVQLNAVTLTAALAQNGVIANGSPAVLEQCLGCSALVASLANSFSQSTLPPPSLRALLHSSVRDLAVLIASQPESFQRGQGLAASLRPLQVPLFACVLGASSPLLREILLAGAAP